MPAKYRKLKRENGRRYNSAPCCADCEHFQIIDAPEAIATTPPYQLRRCTRFPAARFMAGSDATANACAVKNGFQLSYDIAESAEDCERRLSAQASTVDTDVSEGGATSASELPTRSFMVLIDGKCSPQQLLEGLKACLPTDATVRLYSITDLEPVFFGSTARL